MIGSTAVGAAISEDNTTQNICLSRKWRRRMLKIRLQGTMNDIKWFKKMITEMKQVSNIEFSEPFANKGTTKYVRVYGEIERKDSK